MLDQAALRSQLKRLLVTSLHLEGLTPDNIGDEVPLFGDGLGLDSVDVLELVVALEKEFGVKILSHEVDKVAFTSIAHLADFVTRTLAKDARGAQVDGQESRTD
jgi:acyl carrier protein